MTGAAGPWCCVLMAALAVACGKSGGNGGGAMLAGAAGASDGGSSSGGTGGASGGVPSVAGASAAGQAGATAGGNGGGAANAGAAGAGGVATCPFTSDEYLLWAGTPPGDNGAVITETTTERSKDPNVLDRAIAGVSRPSVFPYLAAAPGGGAAIIVPGGGYSYITLDKEGIDIAKWLNAHGVSAFILKYRLPAPYPGTPWIPLADAQRALRTIRSNAAACKIDPERIGIVGFSAGGHLASQLVTRFAEQNSPAADALDAVDARPNFGVLMYPVISMDPTIAHLGSRKNLLGDTPTLAVEQLYSSELQVTASTAPSFVASSKKDTTVKPVNSERFAAALTTAGVPGELHLYEDGGHGTGIRNAPGDMAAWPDQCAAWLETRGVIPP